jgi:hypothetical protein
MVTVWDGERVRALPESEARALVNAGGAQPLKRGMDALKIKPASAFVGYRTRMLRAEAAASVKPETLTLRKTRAHG